MDLSRLSPSSPTVWAEESKTGVFGGQVEQRGLDPHQQGTQAQLVEEAEHWAAVVFFQSSSSGAHGDGPWVLT